eukprot:CAMPEP_0194030232 /NCGR_PEP_ID=MMETSP0009_2-20130614/3783_1 /TAXON_ID=210454 /ORGANISM="Grammatophora oceanica, Strain CCMP 410" /LENGTH=577 /DNA_ID=CAMNT_0038670139 /DNA_START=179 /DNA_END=1912 /DNA_ORIENTATION=-
MTSTSSPVSPTKKLKVTASDLRHKAAEESLAGTMLKDEDTPMATTGDSMTKTKKDVSMPAVAIVLDDREENFVAPVDGTKPSQECIASKIIGISKTNLVSNGGLRRGEETSSVLEEKGVVGGHCHESKHSNKHQSQRSQPVDSTSSTSGKKKRRGASGRKLIEPFGKKLWRMLEEAEKSGGSDVIGFLPHGKTIAVFDTTRFVEEFIPKYFPGTQYSSFLRQLNFYGFRRVSEADGSFSYHHEHLQRGQPSMMAEKIVRKKQTKPKDKKDKPQGDAIDRARFNVDKRGSPHGVDLVAQLPRSAARTAEKPTQPAHLVDQDGAIQESKKSRTSRHSTRQSSSRLGFEIFGGDQPQFPREERNGYLQLLSPAVGVASGLISSRMPPTSSIIMTEQQRGIPLADYLRLRRAASSCADEVALVSSSRTTNLSNLLLPSRVSPLLVGPSYNPVSLSATMRGTRTLASVPTAGIAPATMIAERLRRAKLQREAVVLREREAALTALLNARHAIDILLAASSPSSTPSVLGGPRTATSTLNGATRGGEPRPPLVAPARMGNRKRKIPGSTTMSAVPDPVNSSCE